MSTFTKPILPLAFVALVMLVLTQASADIDADVDAGIHRHLLGFDHHDTDKCPRKCKDSECCKCKHGNAVARKGKPCTTEEGEEGVCKGKYKCKPIDKCDHGCGSCGACDPETGDCYAVPENCSKEECESCELKSNGKYKCVSDCKEQFCFKCFNSECKYKCDEDEICVDGKCVGGGGCTEDADCKNDCLECDEGSGECVPKDTPECECSKECASCGRKGNKACAYPQGCTDKPLVCVSKNSEPYEVRLLISNI